LLALAMSPSTSRTYASLLFVDTALLIELLFSIPVEPMPVANHDLAPAKLLDQPFRDNAEDFVVVAGVRRLQHGKAAFYGQARRDHRYILGKARVMRISHLVQSMPRNDHRHYDCLARAGCHLRTKAAESISIGWHLNANAVDGIQSTFRRSRKKVLSSEPIGWVYEIVALESTVRRMSGVRFSTRVFDSLSIVFSSQILS
jgi:hypothetical protein